MRFPAVVSLLWAEVLESSNYVFGDELLIDAAVMPRLYAMWLEVAAKPSMKVPRSTDQRYKNGSAAVFPKQNHLHCCSLDLFHLSSSNT